MYLSQPPCTSLHLVRRWQRSINPAIVREDGIKMGEFVDEATMSRLEDDTSALSLNNGSPDEVPGEAGRRWHRSYISSDRDWHFEGNIKCSSLSLCEESELEM
jgi:hypothetical protein